MLEWLTAQLATINPVADLQQARARLATDADFNTQGLKVKLDKSTLNLLKSRKSRCPGNQEL